MKTKPEVSIIMCAYNEEKYIVHAIESTLNQSFKNFELIVVDDYSKDNTFDKIINIKDPRLRIIRNEKNLGPVGSRNRGIYEASGEYIFFTDGDCYPKPDWIEEGLKTFNRNDCLGVEGKIILSNDSNSISDKAVKNLTGNEFMTGNIAYKRSVLLKLGGFSDEFKDYYEDRDMAFRVMEHGKIIFNKNMVVEHQLKKWSCMGFIKNAKKMRGLIILYKKYDWTHYIKFRIIKPKELILVFFPVFVFLPLLQGRVSSFKDLIFLPLIYIRAVYMRLIIWKTAIKERIFLL